MAGSQNPAIAKAAQTAKALKAPAVRGFEAQAASLAGVAVYPKGRALPADLLKQGPDESQFLCGYSPENCAAALLDIDGDGVEEVLLSNGGAVDVIKRGGDGTWSKVGMATRPCDDGDLGEAFKAGDARLSDPEPRRDLIVGGLRLRISPAGKACPPPPSSETQPRIRP